MAMDIECYMREKRELVDEALLAFLPPSHGALTRLEESMAYSIKAGGKRLRPILALAASEAVGADTHGVLPVACAIEMVHTYSLIHDDLPSMDDDTMRRGMLTNHSVFGEATAILAGDALLTDAFGVIAGRGVERGLSPERALAVIAELARAAGSRGMAGGQALDLKLAGTDVTVEQVEAMHRMKTGAMIEASVVSGGIAGGGEEGQTLVLREYARALGLAFQIVDDILDVEGGRELGKDLGSDAKKDKAAYPALVGMRGAKRRAAELTAEAAASVAPLGEGALVLREIALHLGKRRY